MKQPNSFLDYYLLTYEFFDKYEHEHEHEHDRAVEFLTLIEIGCHSKKEAISSLCQQAQLVFAKMFEEH